MSKQTVEYFVILLQAAILLVVAVIFFNAIAGEGFLGWLREFGQTHSFPLNR